MSPAEEGEVGQRRARPEVLAFLRDIKEHPDDDTPRLILADWLQDYGDEHDAARGEFIRLQCEAVRIDPTSSQWQAITSRAYKLSEQHVSHWLGPIARIPHARGYDRGLLKLRVHAQQLLDGGNEGVARTEFHAWIDEINFRSLSGHFIPRLGEENWLSGISTIDVRGCRLHLQGMRALLRLQDLAEVKTLKLADNRLHEGGMEELVRPGSLNNLRSLDLAGNGLGMIAIERLAEWPCLADLVSLNLSRNELGDSPVRRFAQSRYLSQMRHLGLGQNRLGDRGIIELFQPHTLGPLESLDLSGNSFGDDGIAALIESPQWRTLRQLNLLGITVTPTSAQLMAEAAVGEKLERLYLSRRHISTRIQEQLEVELGDVVRFHS